MATKKKATVSEKIKETLQQYSKKMCTRVTIFWMLYMIFASVVICVKPDVSSSIIRIAEIVNTVMIINMSVYTANSTVEKVSLAYYGKRAKEELADKEADKDEEELDEEVEEDIHNG